MCLMKKWYETLIVVICLICGIFLGIYFYNNYGIIYGLIGSLFGLTAPLIASRYLLKVFLNFNKKAKSIE